MQGFSGYLVLKNEIQISLKTRPTEEIKNAINSLHLITALDTATKWNKFRFRMSKNNCNHKEFIWDEVWQQEVDKFNNEAKQKI